jgi:hypothetical protein
VLSRLLFALIPQGLEEEQSTDGRVGMLTLLKLSLQYYANTFLLPLLRADPGFIPTQDTGPVPSGPTLGDRAQALLSGAPGAKYRR